MRIVISGYMVRHPMVGNMFAYLHYVIGMHRLGHEVLYLEESGWPNSCYDPVRNDYGDDPTVGLQRVRALLASHGIDVPLVFVNRDSGEVTGADWRELKEYLAASDLLLNLGGVCWLPEFKLCRRRALLDMDPLFTQLGKFGAEALEEHHVYFSYGVNIGRAGCTVPAVGIDWIPSVPPVIPDLWEASSTPPATAPFTTVANWRAYGAVTHGGERYGQKDEEFLRLLELPRRTRQSIELAVSGSSAAIVERLLAHGWLVRGGGEVSAAASTYQDYIQRSRGEFSVAKNAYVKTRSGWFSDRSVCYLAAGRPVIVQDTGFGDRLETGRGISSFSSLDEAVECIERVRGEYPAHSAAARDAAARLFDYRVVLPRMLDEAISEPVIAMGAADALMQQSPTASIIINNYNYAHFLREAIDSALAQSFGSTEVIVVDDGSTDDSRDVMLEYAGRIVPVLKENGGQASALNAGFARSRGQVVLFLDADDVLLPDAVGHAVEALGERDVTKVQWPLHVIDREGRRAGRVFPSGVLPSGDLRQRVRKDGPAGVLSSPTSGNAWARAFLERVLPIPETTYRLSADAYLFGLAPALGIIRSLAEPLGCYRLHGDNYYQGSGFLERLETGCIVEQQLWSALRHHYGADSVEVDTDRWESQSWFHRLRHATAAMRAIIPAGATTILIDDGQWATNEPIPGRQCVPFPERNGQYWGPPSGDESAIEELDRLRRDGADFVVIAWTAFWWLEHYGGLNQHIHSKFRRVLQNDDVLVFDLHNPADQAAVLPLENPMHSAIVSTDAGAQTRSDGARP
jgi:hypothetical protein